MNDLLFSRIPFEEIKTALSEIVKVEIAKINLAPPP